VDHVLAREVASGGRYGLSHRESFGVLLRADAPAFLEDGRAARSVDRTIHATSTTQRRIGGVDDGVVFSFR
jgi:hypothetical protein